VKTVKVTAKRQLTLPVDICERLGVQKGDEFQIEFKDGEIHLRPLNMKRFKPFNRQNPIFDLIGVVEGPPDLSINHDKYGDPES